jgi:hypothetical protein
MQQALEALRSSTDYRSGSAIQVEAVEDLCDALEQPEQEPVETYIHHYRSQPHPNDFGIPKGHWWQAKQYADAVNTTPPAAQPQQVDCPRCGHVCSQREWQGLTDEDVNRESAPITSQMKLAFHAGMYVAQKILKERNT